ncbi:Uu.00g056740.m01.CDS01 [Anthostomella pinea]|uniref:Uu.00g056740.m01.CDS01 n=1 Tax=Anthostomella pinea TaxID=933095 RepID=A0AAI8VS72_9PEZI|nr:Uu.00g056740.m01.CDS01 [Anthostomella pinea]
MSPNFTNRTAAVALILAHLFGLFALHGSLYRSGYIDALIRLWCEGPHYLPGSTNTILPRYTGINLLDKLLTLAGVMFANVTDGSLPQLSLYAVHFAGQYLGILTVLMLEGMRSGNQSSTFRFFSCWACAMQIFSYGLVMPLYGVLHLLTSSASGVFGTELAEAASIINVLDVEVVPEALLIGYTLPAILMSLPLPSNSLHQWFGGLWQGSPLWSMIMRKILCPRLPANVQPLRASNVGKKEWESDLGTTDSTSTGRNNESDKYRIISRAYIFAFICCAASHLVLVVIIFAVWIYPSGFTSSTRARMTLSEVFMPTPFYTTEKMLSMGSAMHAFFQYDQYIGSTAAIIWSSTLYINSRSQPLAAIGWIKLAFVVTVLSLISGPAGAVIWLMWERELVLLSYC